MAASRRAACRRHHSDKNAKSTTTGVTIDGQESATNYVNTWIERCVRSDVQARKVLQRSGLLRISAVARFK